MQLLDKLLSVVAPYDCFGCGVEGPAACNTCLASIPRVPSRCYLCMAASSDYAVCSGCKPKSKLSHVWVSTAYDGLPKELVHIYKYERSMSAHAQIAKMMEDSLPFLIDYVIVAVPTATTRIRQRGYDHALLLAKAVSHRRSFIYEQPVVRVSQSRQVGANRKARFAQLQNSLIVTKASSIKDKKVLLIDDVITTGATLETMAGLMRRHGAKEVSALVFAQKL